MIHDIDKITAQIICGQIRRRTGQIALFRTTVGFAIKRLAACNDREIGRYEFVGAYDRRVSFDQIQKDWNDTL